MDVRPDPELLQVIFDGQARGKVSAFRLRLVHLGLPHVFGHQFEWREEDVELGRKVGDCHFRTPRAHFGALGGIVVNEDKGVRPNVQFRGKPLEVIRLLVPVDSLRDEIGFLQNHSRVRPDRLDVLRIVLRQRNQQNTAALQFQELFLEFRIRHDAGNAILSDDTLPERIVQIDGNGLLAGEDLRELAQPPDRERHLAEFPHLLVIEAVAKVCGQTFDIRRNHDGFRKPFPQASAGRFDILDLRVKRAEAPVDQKADEFGSERQHILRRIQGRLHPRAEAGRHPDLMRLAQEPSQDLAGHIG